METKKRTGFEGGLWVILVLLFGGGIFFLVKSFMAVKSGGTHQLPDGTWEDVNIGIFDTGWIWFAIILLLAGIGALIWMRRER